MKMKYLPLLLLLLTACRHERKVNTSFYYWKTIYKHNPAEDAALQQFHSQNLYVRIMDIDFDEAGFPVPISPVTFKDQLPTNVQIVPVVYVMNDMLKTLKKDQLDILATNTVAFVSAKVKQAGKSNFSELQIDCDWTATTRENYFYLLNELRKYPALKGKKLSVTLRLHQLKNQKASGIPPADKVMLMCYNMGNLRKYGTQNSILDLDELKKYLGDNLQHYPLPADIGLPLFSWAVAFRDKQYIGISKSISRDTINNASEFAHQPNGLHRVVTDLPQFGLHVNDEVRWEDITDEELQKTAKYISQNLHTNGVNILYFHLDENLLKKYPNASLQTISNLLR